MQINTSAFSRSACLEIVAMMSSASKPSTSNVVIPNAVTNSCRYDICDLNSSGVLARLALYSGKISDLKVLRETSNATATCVGFSVDSRDNNIVAKP